MFFHFKEFILLVLPHYPVIIRREDWIYLLALPKLLNNIESIATRDVYHLLLS